MKQRILFVCHGNICRSPMAEFVIKELVKKSKVEDDFFIESAATSTEVIGNSVYHYVREFGEGVDRTCRELEANGAGNPSFHTDEFILKITVRKVTETEQEPN